MLYFNFFFSFRLYTRELQKSSTRRIFFQVIFNYFPTGMNLDNRISLWKNIFVVTRNTFIWNYVDKKINLLSLFYLSIGKHQFVHHRVNIMQLNLLDEIVYLYALHIKMHKCFHIFRRGFSRKQHLYLPPFRKISKEGNQAYWMQKEK